MKEVIKMKIEIKNDLTVNEYNALRRSVGWSTKNDEIVRSAIENSVIVKKVTIDDELAGMARVLGDGMYYFICDVVISLKYQNKGIVEKLMDELIREIENKTYDGQTCTVHLMAVSGKESFYEKCGFTKEPFAHNGYGMMKKIIK